MVDHRALHRGRAPTLDRCSQHLALYPFLPRGCSTGIWPTVGSHFSSTTLHVWGYDLLFTFVTSHPSRPCKRWTAQRSLLSHVSFFLHHLSRVPWSLTASPGPRIVFSLRAPLLGRLLLGAPLPVPSSLVFLPLNTRWSVLWLVRCSKVPVVARSPGVGWILLFRSLDSPLVGLRPFLLPMFHPKLPFLLLALRYWLTLLLHTPTFHLISTSPHNWHCAV